MSTVTRGRARGRAGTVLAAAGVLLTAVSLLSAEPTPSQATTELLQGRLGAWQTAGPVRLFRGAELYGHIDGGAEIFLELGFTDLAVTTLGRGKGKVGAELYRMADPAASLGIYLARSGEETPDRRLAARHTVGHHQLQLVDGVYYLCLDTPEDTTVTAADLVDLAAAIAARLPERAPEELLARLPKDGRKSGSERVIRGPVGLSALITLGDGDILSLGGTVTAVMADYVATADAPAGTLLIADYPDEAGAGRALAHLREHLDPEIKVTGSFPDRLELVDYSGRAGLIELNGVRLTLRLLDTTAKR